MDRDGGDKVEGSVCKELQIVQYGWSKGYYQQKSQENKAGLLGRDQYMKDPCVSAKEFEFNILSEDSGQIRLHFREMALVVVWRIEGRKTRDICCSNIHEQQ